LAQLLLCLPLSALSPDGRLLVEPYRVGRLFSEAEIEEARLRVLRRQYASELYYAVAYRQRERANVLLQQLAGIAPRSAELPYFRGLIQFTDGELGQATTSAQAALAANPAYDPAWNLLGLLYMNLDRPADAAQAFSSASEAAPFEPTYAHNLALALFKCGRLEEALMDADRAARLKNNSADAHDLRGQILQQLKRNGEAVDAYANAERFGLGGNEFLGRFLLAAEATPPNATTLRLCERLEGSPVPEFVATVGRMRVAFGEFERGFRILARIIRTKAAGPGDRDAFLLAAYRTGRNPAALLGALGVDPTERERLLSVIAAFPPRSGASPFRDPILNPPR
jgi:Flp pilus assembly protein TadD